MRSLTPITPLWAMFAIACHHHAYTPPARVMPLSPVQAPMRGEADVQLDGSSAGEPLGPGVLAGNIRYRRGVTDTLAVTGDAGIIRVNDAEEESSLNPNALSARVGMQVHDTMDEAIAAMVFFGAGGGYAPDAGGFVSADVGAGLSGTHSKIRPALVIDAFASYPVATTSFMVDGATLRLPRTFGMQALLGVDIGGRDGGVLLGITMGRLWTIANDVQPSAAAMFLGAGAGFRFSTI